MVERTEDDLVDEVPIQEPWFTHQHIKHQLLDGVIKHLMVLGQLRNPLVDTVVQSLNEELRVDVAALPLQEPIGYLVFPGVPEEDGAFQCTHVLGECGRHPQIQLAYFVEVVEDVLVAALIDLADFLQLAQGQRVCDEVDVGHDAEDCSDEGAVREQDVLVDGGVGVQGEFEENPREQTPYLGFSGFDSGFA